MHSAVAAVHTLPRGLRVTSCFSVLLTPISWSVIRAQPPLTYIHHGILNVLHAKGSMVNQFCQPDSSSSVVVTMVDPTLRCRLMGVAIEIDQSPPLSSMRSLGVDACQKAATPLLLCMHHCVWSCYIHTISRRVCTPFCMECSAVQCLHDYV